MDPLTIIMALTSAAGKGISTLQNWKSGNQQTGLLNAQLNKALPALNAQQEELLRNLTQDAYANRKYRGHMEDLYETGGQELEGALNEFRYGDRPDEGKFIDDMTRLLQINRRKGLDEGVNVLGRQALRMNNSSIIPDLLKQADDMYGKSLEESTIRGRQLGRQDYQTAAGFYDKKVGDDLNRFYKMATNYPQATFDKGGVSSLINNLKGTTTQVGKPFPIGDMIGQATDLIGQLTKGGGLHSPKSSTFNLDEEPLK